MALTEVHLLLEDEAPDSDDDSEHCPDVSQADDDSLRIRGIDILFYWESMVASVVATTCALANPPVPAVPRLEDVLEVSL